MIFNPLLRFNWVFYAIFASELQHSALLSFFVGFSEVTRRGVWTLFRVENEHCTNVGRFRASRDVPLPYHLENSAFTSDGDVNKSKLSDPGLSKKDSADRSRPHAATGTDVEQGPAGDLEFPSGSLRQRRYTSTALPDSAIARGIARVGTAIAQAHAEDFERKRRSGQADDDDIDKKRSSSGASSDEEDEPDPADEHDLLYTDRILDRHPSVTGER